MKVEKWNDPLREKEVMERASDMETDEYLTVQSPQT